MQCRGEWKLARGDSTRNMCVGCAMRMWWATSQSPLQLRGVNRGVFLLMYFLRILLICNMQCRGEWKLARGDSDPRMCAWVRHAGVWHGLHPLGDDLSCSRGLNEVIPTEKYARRACFR
ncbi:MAG: hypothetical protein K2G49_11965 [Muribaculum sp.]|nr:hypothetical protein [Muribaculum sp.]